MAIPTITGVSPALGTPTGGQAVEILGTNFRQQTLPVPGVIPTPEPPKSVSVTFGGTPAVRVEIISDTRVFAYTPKRSMPISGDDTLGSEIVDIVLENIDDNGVLIPTETVTSVGAYTYKRPGISSAESGDFLRVTAEFIDLLRSQVLGNTVLNTSVDYDPDTGVIIIPVENVPQLIVTGPTMAFNSFFSSWDEPTRATGNPSEFFKGRRSRIVDLSYEIMGVTNSDMQLINLEATLITVLDRNVNIDLPIDVNDPGAGTTPIELHITQDPVYERVEAQSKSDIRAFTAIIVLKGFPLNTLPGVAQDAVQSATHEITQDPELVATEKIGENP